jgi:exodeoxyribonuclease VIII
MLRFKDYIEIEAENWSTIKSLAKSPLQYLYDKTHRREDTVGLACGRAIHTAVLEPEKFESEYIVFPGKTRRGKEWDAFKEEHAGKATILKANERDDALAAAEAVKRHPDVAAFMKDGVSEQSFKWVDDATGLTCKCRVDWIGGVLFDLKSTGDIHERKFGNIAARLMYHGQIAMYADGAGHAGPVYIVAVEGDAPHDVSVFEVTADALYAGRELYQGFLKQIVECRAAGAWPGRHTKIVDLELPRYVFEDDEQEDGTAVVVTDDEEAA